MRTPARRVVRGAAAAFVAVLAVGLSATAASAHAVLQLSEPAQSSVYRSGVPPRTVLLVFDAAVTATPTSVRVYDGAGHSVAVMAQRAAVRSKRITVELPRLADGSFVVVWHIVSDDGHPEQGAFTFAVGKAVATTADVGSLLARQASGRGVGFAFGVGRALAFLGCLVFVGGLLLTRWLWADGLSRRDVRQLLWLAAGTAVAATLASIPLQAAYTTVGGFSKMVDGAALGDVVAARFGAGALGRAALLVGLVPFAVVGVGAARSWSRYAVEGMVAALAVGVWASFAYAGHGNTGRLAGLGFVTDVAHLSAASLWLGGVAALAFALRERGQVETNARAAARFSKIALPAIAVVVLSGVAQGWRQIGTWWALWHTSYARLLVIKVTIVLAIVIVASAARDLLRERIVPALRAAAHPGRSTQEDDTMAELRNGVWVEVGLAAVVLAVTASLVVTAPGREAEAAARRPVARTLHLDTAGTRVGYAIVVQPALAGENTIVVTPRLLHQDGFLPLSITAQLLQVGEAGAIPVTFTPLDDGRWVTTAMLPRPGTWQLDLAQTDPTTDTATAQVRIS